MSENKIFKYKFQDMYPLYVQKVKRKGRTESEVKEVISWLTGYTQDEIVSISKNIDLKTFFENAPKINPNAHMIKGSICGVKVQEIEDPIIQQIRYMDKLIDELAKGKALEKILRK